MAATKINKSELKQLIREVLTEMMGEGKLAPPQAQGNVLERVLADTAVTSFPIAMQAEAAMGMGMQQGYGYQQQPSQGYGYPPQGPQYPPQQTMPGWGYQQGYGPPQGMPMNGNQGLLPPPQQTQGDPSKRWASIAFNKPISNRPGSETSGFGNSDGFLPGQSQSGLR